MSEEIWKPVVGYEGLYEVSSEGRVRSLNYKRQDRIQVLVQNYSRKYPYLLLCKDGKSKTHLVHRLVAEAFIPNPDNLPQVNHKDEDKTNNHVDNLEWCSASYNICYNNGAKRRSHTRWGDVSEEERAAQKKAYMKEYMKEYAPKWKASHREHINELQRKRRAAQKEKGQCQALPFN